MPVVERETNTIMRSVGFEFNKPVASADLNESQSIIINNVLGFLSGKLESNTLRLTINKFTGSSTGITVTGIRFCAKDNNGYEFLGYISPNVVLTYPGTPEVGSKYDLYAYWRSVELTPATTVYLNGIRTNTSQPSIVETTTTNNILDTNLNEEVSNRKGLELTFVVVASGGTAPTLDNWSTAVKVSELTITSDGVSVNNLLNPIDPSVGGGGGTSDAFYDTIEEAKEDLENIEEGTLVYTNDDDSLQDIIDGMTSLHLAGSQVGAGTKNFTFNTEAQKRMLCITKKSGVIVESKEIPVDVLSTNDVIPLGETAPVIGNGISLGLTDGTNSKSLSSFSGNSQYLSSSNNIGENVGTNITNPPFISSKTLGVSEDPEKSGLVTDLSNALGASITYNGNNSFTITVTDSTLSVYVYVDMLVLGGSASARNVSFDAAGTELVSTDVEGAILELNNDLTANSQKFEASYQNGKYGFMINGTFYEIGGGSMPVLDFANPIHTFTIDGSAWTATQDCYLFGGVYCRSSSETVTVKINNEPILVVNGSADYVGSYATISPIKIKSGNKVQVVASANPTLQKCSLKTYREL